jgi:hypothetical protein
VRRPASPLLYGGVADFATASKIRIVVKNAKVAPMITPCTTPELATEAKEPLMITAHRTSQPMCDQPVNLARRSARDHFRLSMPHGPEI